MHKQRSGFTFKQFHVAHDQCAMKVGTDGILLAAWLPMEAASLILDVGTGTGLISLILAQRTKDSVQIDAIDIEADACRQAQQNVKHSPWPNKVMVRQQSMQLFKPSYAYDLIVSNPPYFPAGQEFDKKRQLARHSGELNAQQFFAAAESLSHNDTHIALVLPCDVAARWLLCAESHQWYLERQGVVSSVMGKAPIRNLLLLSRNSKAIAVVEQILIYQEDKRYSSQYVNLCGELYLKM
ncbi:tRNA1(Val) (adenine(37)-N6)-methyltransferase [Agarivorans sp. MS3-6]|uniref:tRNA1(Val) (adenine(37)-N6)-methyltransferase n=1 Tax=Agarivorans sp. TSD2052 TaxID=2937286 RepID=UPI00200F81E4|nr:methyltransferase [Agarivorans sp. TSD2052]UPW17815.1 methyltransferase [Agarivorans sp. TSD2052]